MMDYYQWQKTLSFNAALNLIITARGRGKTYGFRKQAILDYLKDGSRFVEIVRYNRQVNDVCDGYFTKLKANGEFENYEFRTQGAKFYIAKSGEKKPKWELIGYCVSLNDAQNAKKKTFANVKRIMFDEFILEKRTHAGYLPGEYAKFANLLNTIAREDPTIDYSQMTVDELLQITKIRVYLCANSCDIVNPYFTEFGIVDEPKRGFTWLVKGLVLLHFEDDESYSDSMSMSLVGRLSRSHNRDMYENSFSNAHDGFIEKKPKDAKYLFSFVYRGITYAIWVSYVKGNYYITANYPNNAGQVYTLTKDDNAPNVIVAKRADYKLKSLLEMFYTNALRFETPALREGFTKMLSLLGVR